MSKKIKIKLLSVPIGAKYDVNKSSLVLKQAESFSVIINKPDTVKAKSFDDVEWVWQIVGKGAKNNFKSNQLITAEAQNNFRNGLNLLKISFPKFLEGSGLCWLEAFRTENKDAKPPVDADLATGNDADGLYVSATGIPKIIAAEWKDKDENKITKSVAFGSTVYLHIYTEALFDEYIEVQLRDTALTNADLTPTPIKKDNDGQVIQSLEFKPLKRFTRKVDVVTYKPESKPQSTPPNGAQTGYLSTHKLNSKTQVLSEANVQKCVFEVFIEQNWQFEGAGKSNVFDFGRTLEINPIVYHPKLKDGMKDLDVTLKVDSSMQKPKDYNEEKGNNPAVIGEAEKVVSDDKNIKDFTFGIFIDGTGNNRYDTIARTNWEKKRLGESKDVYNNAEHLKIFAKSKKDIIKGENYKYGEVSYENDLSNPAILFDNYLKDDKTIFKVYTEGMGTNTLADENLNVISYEENDMEGKGFGTGTSGIVLRVTRAIEQMVEKIRLRETEKIGTLTIDVFGFSRGAAAARHFVHEITLNPYFLNDGFDHMDRIIDAQYFDKYLPKGGYLSYLLTVKGVEYKSLVIRFAGLYDSVPHYGLIQKNNISKLGLNSISKAKHILHMTAGDEHRKNFSLARIIRKKNHIELNMPGVHCDVGGSYIEGRPEGLAKGIKLADTEELHILQEESATDIYSKPQLEAFRKTLLDEGWFQDHQIEVNYDANNQKSQLISQRAYLSNQYSYIPLHMMCNYAIDRGLPFNFTNLKKKKNFSNNPIDGHLALMSRLQKNLEDYANKIIANPTASLQYEIDEADLKKLRNNYLHYNAVVGVINAPETGRKRYILPA
jgi:Uncharacterized alpha/beta hydrolase domain (DUF2235)